jgi:hypothetical protein
MAVWYSLWFFDIFFPVLVCLDQEKSGNPDPKGKKGTRGRNIFLPLKI